MTGPQDTAPRSPRSRPVLVVAALVVLVAAAWAGGAVVTGLLDHRESRHFERWSDAPTRGDLAFVLPDVVPRDARDITVHVRTDDPDAKMYDWTSAGDQLATDTCTTRETSAVAPPFDASEWPDSVDDAQGLACGSLFVRKVADRYYAWIV